MIKIFLNFLMRTLPLNFSLERARVLSSPCHSSANCKCWKHKLDFPVFSLIPFDITPQVTRCCNVAKFVFMPDKNLLYCSTHDKEKL